jgi:Ni/Co efflux regulator RcnB
MTTRHLAAGIIALLTFTVAVGAHAKYAQATTAHKATGQTQFNDHDRQAANDWYTKNQAHPPAGFGAQDHLSSDQEARLKIGSTLDADLLKVVHTVPADLKRQLAAPASGYRYVAVGGHVALLDKQNQVHDVIHHP